MKNGESKEKRMAEFLIQSILVQHQGQETYCQTHREREKCSQRFVSKDSEKFEGAANGNKGEGQR